MDKILMSRNQGKTMHLIRMSYFQKHVIVCMDHREARRIISMAKETGFEGIPKPITYYEFLHGDHRITGERFHRGVERGYLIDEFEMFAKTLKSAHPIYAVTMNSDDVKVLKFKDTDQKTEDEQLNIWDDVVANFFTDLVAQNKHLSGEGMFYSPNDILEVLKNKYNITRKPPIE
jgi:hypothetical protein